MPLVTWRSQGSEDSETGPCSSKDLVRNGPGDWALDCRSWSLHTLCPLESSRIAPAGRRQRAALYRRPAPVHTALSCRRDRPVYGGCVQSTRMVSGTDVRCRTHIRREVRSNLGAGMAQRKQLSRGSGRDAGFHSKELGVDRCGHRHRRLLYFRARPGRTLRALKLLDWPTSSLQGQWKIRFHRTTKLPTFLSCRPGPLYEPQQPFRGLDLFFNPGAGRPSSSASNHPNAILIWSEARPVLVLGAMNHPHSGTSIKHTFCRLLFPVGRWLHPHPRKVSKGLHFDLVRLRIPFRTAPVFEG
jgi:hypothetical protein